MMRDDATRAQIAAADPGRSTWVSANAGSGKTRVLTDRVARMLLAGVNPARILCLTYTKAAASEMQNRLFLRLGAWAMLPDAPLRAALADLGIDGALTGDTLSRARRLFATAIETPGGLRIQTIHSFCASLLRRFPLEAGVSPRFAEMDDRTATLLRAEIIEDLADGLAPGVMARVAAAYTGEDFGALAAEVAGKRTAFKVPLSGAEVRAVFGVPAQDSMARIADDTLGPEGADLITTLVAHLGAGSTNDVKAAQKLAAFDADRPDLAVLEDCLLYKDNKDPAKHFGAKTGAFPTKATRARMADMLDELDSLMRRVERARHRRIALQAADRTAVLHEFARAFLPEYAARKAARGLLDFDDLILRARALLTDPSVAQWVLFRLDGGIDHILVDEAQDTSPVQWQVIECLAAEFTAGRGAGAEGRTLFVVGDAKQSIYSFQGADLRTFAAKETRFAASLADAGTPLQQTGLHHSFRSSPAILRLVDMTFDASRGRALESGAARHIAHRADMPGRIELWPPFEKARDPEPEHWYDPVDLPTGEHHAARLGAAVAARIREMIDARVPIPGRDGMRAVGPGDFLILVRRRSDIFNAVIRACKAARLPIAGSDRLKLGGELAVRDLTALLSFLALPEDDLSLAAALRSPLFGWSEDDLYRLAQGRQGFLWTALRGAPDVTGARAVIDDLRGQADFLRPFDLLERILTRHDGRRRLVARLGTEAEDGIDEVLSQALVYEQQAVPSLTGFLVWLDADAVEVKRQTDAGAGRIRVMTVHGAKGLEAPVVILPDTAAYRRRERDEVMVPDDGPPLWKTPADASPPLIEAARAERQAREEAESLRLLYVAMTRAQSWLIVAAAGELGKETTEEDAAPPAWYHLIAEGMEHAGARPREGGGLELIEGDWSLPVAGAEEAPAPVVTALPGWAMGPAPDGPRRAPVLSPSGLGGAKVMAGDPRGDGDAARRRGTALHRLLEHLPEHDPADWAVMAPLLTGEADCDDLLAEASAVLADPTLAALFAGSLAEVPFVADLDGRRIAGAIDRLVVTPDRVLAVDFKSNRVVPDRPEQVPEGILRQMGAYAAALAQIYPGRAVEVAVLWTQAPRLMVLPPDIVRDARMRATIP